jgi:hypothetical protein
MATKKWLPIVVGIVIFVFVVGAGLIGGLVYVVTRQVNVQQLSATRGLEEFERLAARFAGQKALIEMPAAEDGEMVVHHELETHDTGSISTLRVCVWSPSDRKLVRIDLPFWTMRLTGNRPIELHVGGSGAMTLAVTPDQIDRRGPGLVLSYSRHGGERVLIWTE